MLRLFLLFILIFFFNPFHFRGQSSEIIINHITKADGLSDVSFNSFFFKDSKGYLWISTNTSLDKYNSESIESYPLNSEEEGKIKGNYIQGTFFEDNDQNLWFATYNAINCYKRETNNFSYFQIPSNKGDTIKQGYHLIYFNNATGKIWFLADKSICSIDKSNSNSLSCLPMKTKGVRFEVMLNKQKEVSKIFAGLWIEEGLEIFTKNATQKWKHQQNKLSNLGQPQITKIIKSQETNIWLVSSKGLIEFNEYSEPVAKLYRPNDNNIVLRDGAVFKNQIVLTTGNKGLLFFDISKEKFTQNLTTTSSNKHKIHSNSPSEIYIDKNNQLWISQRNFGIENIIINKSNYTFVNNEQLKIGRQPIKYILHSKNKIYISTNLGGTFEIVFQNSKLKGKRINNPLPLFHFLTYDEDENLFLLSENAIYQKINSQIKKLLEIKGLHLFDLLNLSGKKKLLSTSNGLIEINILKDSLQTKSLSENLTPEYSDIFSLFKRKNKDIIIAPGHNSLAICTLTDSFRIKKQIPINAEIISFYENPISGISWIGTSKGVGRLDKENNFQFLLQEDWEIGKKNILNIREDEENRLWVLTSSELWKYDLANKSLERHLEGLTNYSFLRNQHFKRETGEICFGATTGILCFYPDSVNVSSANPKVQIEAAWVNEQPYNGNIVISETEKLNLNYQQNSLSFKVTTLDYYYPEFNQVRYRLKGYKEEWVLAQSGAIIPFYKLPAGKKYDFEVIGINANNVESPVRSLSINISLPFWQKWWFPFLIIGIITAIITGIARLYIRQQLKQKQIELDRQLALTKQREEIADNLHDEIGSDLGKILAVSEMALLENTKDIRKEVDNIAEMTVASLRNLRYMMKVLDGQHNEKEPLDNLIKELRGLAHQFLDNYCEYDLQILNVDSTLLISGKVFREILLLTKEVFSNILKHAKASKVFVELKAEDNWLNIKIQDNGIGFDIKEKKGKGRGLSTIERRISKLNGDLTLNTQAQKGTLIQFKIPMLPNN